MNLSLRVTPHIDRSILNSFTSIRFSCSFVVAHASAPYSIGGSGNTAVSGITLSEDGGSRTGGFTGGSRTGRVHKKGAHENPVNRPCHGPDKPSMTIAANGTRWRKGKKDINKIKSLFDSSV